MLLPLGSHVISSDPHHGGAGVARNLSPSEAQISPHYARRNDIELILRLPLRLPIGFGVIRNLPLGRAICPHDEQISLVIVA